MPDDGALQVTVPEKAAGLFLPKRYKVIKGGRGKGGSWSCARALLIEGYRMPLRILGAREIQRTIDESVHQLFTDQVKLLGLEGFYHCGESSIEGANGTSIIYAGLRHLDITKIMSLEGIDRVWVEQGEVISKRSWDILIPTIRKEGSEIWINMNPQLDTDETYKRFIAHPPHDCVVMEINWRDNPWFPEVLEKERQTMLERVRLGLETQETYDNIWEGKCRSAVEGAIYAAEIRDAIEQGRVRPMPYDPKLKVHTVWDLGWNDRMSIGFFQRLMNQLMVIDFLEDSHKKYDWYVEEIKKKRYNLGNCFLPHDAGHESPLPGDNPVNTLRAMGMDCPEPPERGENVEVGIKRVRQTFPRIYFDEVKAAPLLEHLRRYRRSVPVSSNEPQGPIHDEHSHAADMLRNACMVAESMTNDEKDAPLPPPRRIF